MSRIFKEPDIENYYIRVKKRNLVVLYVINVLHGVVIGFFNSVYQSHLYNLTLDEFKVGIIQSTGFLMMLVAMLFSGLFAEKIGKKNMILIGTGIFMSGFAVLYLGRTPFFLILGSMLIYGGFGCLDPSWVTVISHNTNEKNRGLVYALIYFFFFGGSIAGSLVVNLLEDFSIIAIIGLETTAGFYFLISIALMFLEGLIQGMFLNDKSISENQKNLFGMIKNKKKIWLVYIHDKALLLLLVFFILDAFIWGISIQLYYTALRSSANGFGISEAELALYVVFIVNLGNLLLQIPAGWLVDKIGSKISFILSEIFGLGFLIVNIVTWFLPRTMLFPMLIVAQAFWTLMAVPFIPAQNKIITRIYPERTAEIYGFMNFTRNIFWFGAGYLAGWILRTYGFTGPLFVGVIGVVLEIIYLFLFIDEKKLVQLTSVT
ncbi:MAG: MFS transporter [Candidatus Lokiarchaeota archaeon]|nr:MFS transporter [Candidatus Lokiarchaeota archaeon]